MYPLGYKELLSKKPLDINNKYLLNTPNIFRPRPNLNNKEVKKEICIMFNYQLDLHHLFIGFFYMINCQNII